jgi:hypothetical protein
MLEHETTIGFSTSEFIIVVLHTCKEHENNNSVFLFLGLEIGTNNSKYHGTTIPESTGRNRQTEK